MKPIQINQSAFISVDNTRTFDDKSLDELYVPEGVLAAIKTKEAADLCATFGMVTINVYDKHPKGHISFASSFKDKEPRDFITLEEVNDWTDEENGLSEQANFTVDELKEYLSNSPDQKNQVWPDHGKDWTESIELMPPLEKEMFDLHIIKGEKVNQHPYGGFLGTKLQQELEARGIKRVFITGVATDYCSGKTALEASERGYDTYIITEAMRGVIKEKTEEMLDLINAKGIKSITLHELEELLQKSV